MKVGDVAIVAPYCKGKFEIGQIIGARPGACWAVRMWGIRRHPSEYGSNYNYGKIIVVTKNNAWKPSRLGEAISYWLDKEAMVRG